VTFLLFVAVLAMIIGCLIFLGLKLTSGELDFTENLMGGVMVIFAMVFLGAGGAVIVYYATVDFLLEKGWVLEEYGSGRARGELRNMEIIPVDMD
jgi:hypothetical protein